MDILSERLPFSDKLVIGEFEYTEEECGLAMVRASREAIRSKLGRMINRKGINPRERDNLVDLYLEVMVLAGLVERHMITEFRNAA